MTQILNIPAPTKETKPRQRSINISDLFLTRFSPPWTRPPSLPAYTWRNWVLNQPVAMAYRETLIANILSLDWNITPRDANYKKELEATVKYYTKLLNDGGNYLGTDYTGLVEWIAGDVLDLPFGGAAEVGRKGDVPGGRVAWLRPLDAGTLYPTLNAEYPAVQYYQGYDAIAFPAHAFVRTYLSPQSYIYREGWGMAPPEKAYFAVNLLNTGDKYYANLLLDVPTAGILDLGDMEKSSAEEWVTAFKTFVNDTATSFRVPVLYEHNNPVNFIPFGKVPNDIMYDTITIKYAALLGAAYGMTTSDIGLKDAGSGNTLAGTIRDERRSRRTGFAKLKLKMKYFFDKILPPSLEFTFVDFDSELSLNLGRARLASATAFNSLQTNGNFSQQEIRSQMIQDGLVNINIPDKLPKDAKQKQEAKFWHDTLGQPAAGANNPDSQKKKPGEPEMTGNPKTPSTGGEGDVKKMASLVMKSRVKNIEEVTRNLVLAVYPKVLEAISGIGEDELYLVKSTINNSLFDDEDILELQPVLKSVIKGKPLVQLKFNGLEEELKSLTGVNKDLHIYTNRLEQRISRGINPFLANALTVMLNDITITDEGMNKSLDDIVSTLSLGVSENLENLVDVFVSDELDKTLEEIHNSVVSEPVVVEKITEKSAPMPTINMPAITVNVPQPERQERSATEDDMKIVINNPANVNMESERQSKVIKSMTDNMEKMHKALNDNTAKAPVINVQVNPTPVTVQNDVQVDVPEIKVNTPEVTVNVEPTPITVKNDAPVVNVQSPDVVVNVPKVKKEVQKINRDRMGNIASTETNVEYDE